jgi:hypothetical protein
MKRSKKAEFRPGQEDAFRRQRPSADQLAPVRNMKDWGCNGDVIREPRYADRAYEYCAPVGMQCYDKIVGIVQDIMPPRMLGKQKFNKPANLSEDTVRAAAGYKDKQKQLTNFRDLDKRRGRDLRKKK